MSPKYHERTLMPVAIRKATGSAILRMTSKKKKARLLGRALVQGPGVGTRVGNIEVLII
jgi:hypothetical protein